MTAEDFRNRVTEARPKFLRRLVSLQKSFKEFRVGVEFFSEFMELEADKRLLTCQHFNGEYCNAWERKTIPNSSSRQNYDSVEGKYYLKDPGLLCALCPLYEQKEITR